MSYIEHLREFSTKSAHDAAYVAGGPDYYEPWVGVVDGSDGSVSYNVSYPLDMSILSDMSLYGSDMWFFFDFYEDASFYTVGPYYMPGGLDRMMNCDPVRGTVRMFDDGATLDESVPDIREEVHQFGVFGDGILSFDDVLVSDVDFVVALNEGTQLADLNSYITDDGPGSSYVISGPFVSINVPGHYLFNENGLRLLLVRKGGVYHLINPGTSDGTSRPLLYRPLFEYCPSESEAPLPPKRLPARVRSVIPDMFIRQWQLSGTFVHGEWYLSDLYGSNRNGPMMWCDDFGVDEECSTAYVCPFSGSAFDLYNLPVVQQSPSVVVASRKADDVEVRGGESAGPGTVIPKNEGDSLDYSMSSAVIRLYLNEPVRSDAEIAVYYDLSGTEFDDVPFSTLCTYLYVNNVLCDTEAYDAERESNCVYIRFRDGNWSLSFPVAVEPSVPSDPGDTPIPDDPPEETAG